MKRKKKRGFPYFGIELLQVLGMISILLFVYYIYLILVRGMIFYK